MAGKLITLEEAAHILGVSPAEVAEMRQRQELYGYRDGGNWKFKQEDVERLATDRSGSTPGGSGLGLPVDLSDDNDQVVLSEFELGDSGPGSSTVIGGSKKKADSDLKLIDSGIDLSGGSDLNLVGDSVLKFDTSGSGPKKGGSGDASDKSNVLGTGGSDLNLAATSDVRLADVGNDSSVLSGGSSGGPGGSMAAGKTMLTAELVDKPAAESAVKLTMRESDSDSVFGDTGSDVTRNVGGSGINLLSPQDSGMLLDDLDLSGASGLATSMGDESDIKGDDDFLLTPSAEGGDDSTDSGSQVIALDGDFGGDDATATLLAGDVPGLSDALGGGLDGGYGQPAMVGGGYATVPDTHFGIGSVAALGICAVFMTLTGIMMYDIVRNMWSWDAPLPVSSTLMDMIPGVRK